MNLVEKARLFAKEAHEGQVRKLTNDPYFVHTEGVATILKEAGLSQEVIAAGYLHDTVEDTDVSMEVIQKEFGEVVASLVSSNTEDKTKSWEERKEHTIKSLKTADINTKCLVVADKLDNLKSLLSDSTATEDIWLHFKRGRDQQAWYYRGIANSILENVQEEDTPQFFKEFRTLVDEFFKE